MESFTSIRPFKNKICLYCGLNLTKESRKKEHVIGRGFVPEGTLENRPNLIFYSCENCNNEKSKLEDDISAITMQPDISGNLHERHPKLIADAKRKASGSTSRMTGKKVTDSKTDTTLKFNLDMGFSVKMNLIGPAQIAPERAYALALRHFQGFFFLITYDHFKKHGYCWLGVYAPIQCASKSDWGNQQALSFMKTTDDWAWRVHTVTADGHFKIAIRKHPDQSLWSLAVEWNKNFRVLAVAGEDNHINDFLLNLSPLKWSKQAASENETIRVRQEIPIDPIDDTLFRDPLPPEQVVTN